MSLKKQKLEGFLARCFATNNIIILILIEVVKDTEMINWF